MKVLLTGGGTGGHITPILAVAHELKQARPDTEVVYVGERNGKFKNLVEGHVSIDATYSIFAGKFRRYYRQSWIARIFDLKTNLLNVRDGFYVLVGVVQAWHLLGRVRPDVVFLKGGFVGVPIGLAASLRHVPIVTHDSDALSGLANRIVSRWAKIHATALPRQYYPYPPEKVRTIGVLVDHAYQPVTPSVQAEYKKKLSTEPSNQLLLITGASSGAVSLNKAVISFVEQLLESHTNLFVIHQVGKGRVGMYNGFHHERLNVQEFLQPMYLFMGAADLVVSRASATNMAELGILGKACIAIPNPNLTGGHQLKNAKILEQNESAAVIYEEDLYDKQQGLLATVLKLLDDNAERQRLSFQLQATTITGAAEKLAQLILSQAKSNKP